MKYGYHRMGIKDKPTPEERLEEKIDKLETDVERIDKDVTILKNNLNMMD